MDEAATKEELRPVKKQLKDLKLSGDDMPREKKVAILKDSLSAIGRRIEAVLKAKADALERMPIDGRSTCGRTYFPAPGMQRCC
jgi:chromodomain-helicase-DNA-binding protein 1